MARSAAVADLCGPASGVAGGRGADLARREQRVAPRGTKASSAAVSFTRSVKEKKTANLGHGNGPLLVVRPAGYRWKSGPFGCSIATTVDGRFTVSALRCGSGLTRGSRLESRASVPEKNRST